MKVLKILVVILVLILFSVIVLAIIAPKSFEVHRQITINAQKDVVWKGISTFEEFNKWNPWNKIDTTEQVKDEGQDGTVGAIHSWKGNKQVGEGAMTITKVEPGKYVEYDLHFIKPWQAHNVVNMKMEPADGAQKVTWSMSGPLSFPMNIFGVFMSMDKMIGKDFETGLAELKKLCESAPAYKVTETDWTEKNCLSLRKTISFKELPDFFGSSYGKIYEAISKAGSKPGIPLGIFYTYDEKNMTTDVAAALPYDIKKNFGKGFDELHLPVTKAYLIDYYGAYEKMKPAYDAMDAKLKELGQDKPAMAIEEYITDPMSEKDTAKWHTKLYYILKSDVAQK